MDAFTPGTKIACPCCAKSVAVKSSGIAHHGYTTRGGIYRVGAACPAVGAKSERAAIEQQIEALRVQREVHVNDMNSGVRVFANRDAAEQIKNKINELVAQLGK